VEEADRLIEEAFKGKSVIAKLASTIGPVPPTAGFADCAPLHLASNDSLAGAPLPRPTCSYAHAACLVLRRLALAELNARIVERGEEAVALDRFRANIVVGEKDGDRMRAHHEDGERAPPRKPPASLADFAKRCVRQSGTPSASGMRR